MFLFYHKVQALQDRKYIHEQKRKVWRAVLLCSFVVTL